MPRRTSHGVTTPDNEVATWSEENIKEQWRRWLVEIRNQIWMLQLDDFLHQGMLAMTQANHDIEDDIFTIRLENSLYETQLMAIRRLVDSDKDVISFGRLFNQVLYLLAQTPPRYILTRKAFEEQYNKKHFRRRSRPSRAFKEFDRLVGPGKDFLTKEDLGKDRQQLSQSFEKVRQYTNNIVSHYTVKTMDQLRPGPAADPTSTCYPAFPPYEDLENARVCLVTLLEKYWMLLYADSDWQFPVMASDPWKIFERPWITDSQPNMPIRPNVANR